MARVLDQETLRTSDHHGRALIRAQCPVKVYRWHPVDDPLGERGGLILGHPDRDPGHQYCDQLLCCNIWFSNPNNHFPENIGCEHYDDKHSGKVNSCDGFRLFQSRSNYYIIPAFLECESKDNRDL